MIEKLDVYNEALRLLGDSRLAALTDAVPSRLELDRAWARSILYVLRQVPWRFAARAIRRTATADPVITPWARVFSKPADWLRTYAIWDGDIAEERPIDIREYGALLYSDAVSVRLRYISNAPATPVSGTSYDWPEHFGRALAAFLAFETAEKITGSAEKAEQVFTLWQRNLGEAASIDAVPESPWLRYQLDGTFVAAIRHVLGLAPWNFALENVQLSGAEIANGVSYYPYKFTLPVDMLFPVWAYRDIPGRTPGDVEYRIENGFLYADTDALSLRFISKDGLAPAKWTEPFLDVVLTYLQKQETAADPKSAALLQVREAACKEALARARLNNEALERPQMRQAGYVVRARTGYYGARFSRTEQGL